jgi:hypothetical protein
MTEKNVSKIETKIDNMYCTIMNIDKKMSVLENTLVEREKQSREQHEAIYKHAHSAHERIDEVEANLSKGIWLVLSSVILTIMGLIFK